MVGISTIESVVDREDSTNLPYDAVCDLLSHEYRRICIVCLATNDQLLTLDRLANEIASYEHKTDSTEIPPLAIQQIQVALDHTHLPRLAAANVIAYDRDNDLIQATEHFDQLYAALSRLTDNQTD